MKYFMLLFLATVMLGCSSSLHNSYRITKNYKPDDTVLYDTIMALDSQFFGAYNTCSVQLDKYASFFADSIEFYHDKGGLMTSKTEIIAATQKNVCGRVTRQLVKGSAEVYPVPGYGAIEIGLHTFHNSKDVSGGTPRPGRFTIIWQHTATGWKIRRVISLH
ncbi:MAG TPA: nuclear transport factor 2 family protein [Ferruginibacter sp.]|nr:nuclear transport factor 2 family protein [Ferruginibacter sp.]HMP22115.1 nuclear transport factor 2 family protein [Ferruginibacter sp.]